MNTAKHQAYILTVGMLNYSDHDSHELILFLPAIEMGDNLSHDVALPGWLSQMSRLAPLEKVEGDVSSQVW